MGEEVGAMKTLCDGGRCHHSSGADSPRACVLCGDTIEKGVDYYSVSWPTRQRDQATVCKKCIHAPVAEIERRERKVKGLSRVMDQMAAMPNIDCKICGEKSIFPSYVLKNWPPYGYPLPIRERVYACKSCGEMDLDDAVEAARLTAKSARMVKALS